LKHILIVYVRSCRNYFDRITLFWTLLPRMLSCSTKQTLIFSVQSWQKKANQLPSVDEHITRVFNCKAILHRICRAAVVCTYI